MPWKPPARQQPRPQLESHLDGSTVVPRLAPVAARASVERRIVPLPRGAEVRARAPAASGAADRRPAAGADDRLVEIAPDEAWTPGGEDAAEDRELIAAIAMGAVEIAADDGPCGNPDLPAGYAYLVQFIEHDITCAARPSDRAAAPLAGPALALNGVYGGPPPRDPVDADKLAIGRGCDGAPDLPRARRPFDAIGAGGLGAPNPALIGDPRNDGSLPLGQIHLAFLRFHNAQVERGLGYAAARAHCIERYQAMVLADFLPRVCGRRLVAGLLDGSVAPRFAFPRAGRAFLPREFALAAFRFGEALLRCRSELNDRLEGGLPIHGGGAGRQPERPSLRGGRSLPAGGSLQFDRFFDFDGRRPAQRARLIRRALAWPLMDLPLADEGVPIRRSLAYRTLLRGWQAGLPSGQALARRIGLAPIDPGQETPLWLYILEEAWRQCGGRHLGTLGGHIVAETLLGLLRADPGSLLNRAGAPGNETYGFSQFVREAGMPLGADDIAALTGRRGTATGRGHFKGPLFHHA